MPDAAARDDRAREYRMAAVLFSTLILGACARGGGTVIGIAPHPQDAKILYVVTHQGVLKSTDGGEEWQRVFTGVSHSRVLAIGIDPEAPSTIFLGTKDDGFYMSYDGGRHWLSRRKGLDDVRVTAEVQQIVFARRSPKRIYLATAMGVFESDDEDQIWHKAMSGMIEVLMVTVLAVDPDRPETLFAGTSSGIYKTTNGAETWNAVNAGLIAEDRATPPRTPRITCLAIDPHHPQTLYAGSFHGLFMTIDAGASWFRIGKNLPDQFISSLALDVHDVGVLYVGGRAGVSRTRDGGQTWESRNERLTNTNILSFAVSPAAPNVLYAGTNGNGLFRSTNRGATWESVLLQVE